MYPVGLCSVLTRWVVDDLYIGNFAEGMISDYEVADAFDEVAYLYPYVS